MKILVFLEIRENNIKRASLEALSEARRLADKSNGFVVAVILGSKTKEVIKEKLLNLSDKVILVNDSFFDKYSCESYSYQLDKIVRKENPNFIFIASTVIGKEIAARLSAKLKASLFSDCVSLNIENSSNLIAIRPIYSGKLLAEVFSKDSEYQMALLRPNVFPLIETPAAKEIQYEEMSNQFPIEKLRSLLKEVKEPEKKELDISEAQIIVAGGRGLKAAENFKILEELAKPLGAAIGASRAAVDAGWIDHSHQVGQTGKVVSPLLYFAIGISGSIQHLAGMSSSKCIVAINKDPEAPIFQIADYGIIGDLFEIVPLLTEEIKKAITV